MAGVAQLVRAPDCDSGGREFKSHHSPQIFWQRGRVMIKSNTQISNTMRFLSSDMVTKAASGHPGMPMGMADVMSVLFLEFLQYNIDDPSWINRDRFILSAGHGSALLYSTLHLMGSKHFTMEELKSFRQKGSITAGHPEYSLKHGIEATTGPLGQGIANAVGIALSEKVANSKFPKIIDHYTYVMAGDGCLMEGISHEVLSLAGSLSLNKLILFWDNNNITIDGKLSDYDKTNTKQRFLSYNWNYIAIDGHNQDEIRQAIVDAQKSNKPVIIDCKTIIGKGSSVEGTAKAHGSPLTKEDIVNAKKALGFESQEEFFVNKEIYDIFAEKKANMHNVQNLWKQNLTQSPTAKEFKELLNKDAQEAKIIDALNSYIEEMKKNKSNMATRTAFGNVIEKVLGVSNLFFGGSADLTPSVNTKSEQFSKTITFDDFNGNYLRYGIREHGMFSIMNGIALHGLYIPYGGTFLAFIDYCHSSLRMSSIMGLKSLYILTHDSIGLGEDGPTHQPIEHLSMLNYRLNTIIIRPADILETIEGFKLFLKTKHTPFVLALSRQSLPFISHNKTPNISKGAYILKPQENYDFNIIASGSEVHLALEVAKNLAEQGIKTQVVSMPSVVLFLKQNKEEREKIVKFDDKNVVIEASSLGRYSEVVNIEKALMFGIFEYGISAPIQDVYKHFGLTIEDITKKILDSNIK